MSLQLSKVIALLNTWRAWLVVATTVSIVVNLLRSCLQWLLCSHNTAAGAACQSFRVCWLLNILYAIIVSVVTSRCPQSPNR